MISPDRSAVKAPLYAYDLTYVTDDLTANGKIDPTQPEGSRITIYSPAKEDWPKDFEKGLKEIDADADGDIWCAGLLDTVPGNAELVSDDGDVARYTSSQSQKTSPTKSS